MKHPYKGVKTSPSRRVLKTLRGKFVKESPKRTISGSVELGSLQIVSKPNTKQCASKEGCSPKGGRHEAICQDAAQRRVDFLGVPH